MISNLIVPYLLQPKNQFLIYVLDDEGEMWQENLPATELQDLASSSNIFAFLESQRTVLEEKIGIERSDLKFGGFGPSGFIMFCLYTSIKLSCP